ncbi:uncharacterized protein [Panulirus ornatus]|uniref:uncharacterized protein isoform X2 n=1 Tax=Panulirus ornatus TaxID=150431 RepID=UPI003A89044A
MMVMGAFSVDVSCGGRMVANKSGPHTIRLFPRGERGFGKVGDFFNGQYIHDCIKKRRLLPIIDYRLNETSRYDASVDPMDILLGKLSWDECKLIDGRTEFEVSDFSDDENSIEPQKIKKFKSRGLPYSGGERKAILKYIINKKRYGEVKGRLLWEDMAKAEVCPGRTWQSMKQQYRTYIIDNLVTFKLPDNVARRIYAPYCKTGNDQHVLTSEEEPEPGGTGLGSNMQDNGNTAGEKGQVVKDMNDVKIVSEDKQQENGGETSRGSTIEHCAKTDDDDDEGQHEKDENEHNVLKENEEKESTREIGQGSTLEQYAGTANNKRQVENEQKTVNLDQQKENGRGEPKMQETSLGSSEELCAMVTDGKREDERKENDLQTANKTSQNVSGEENLLMGRTTSDCNDEQYGESSDEKDGEDEKELKSMNENELRESVCQSAKENLSKDETLGTEHETRRTRKGKEQVVNENAIIENKERRNEHSDLDINLQGDIQENHWIEQESEGLNSQQCNKRNIDEDLEKQESEYRFRKRRENEIEDCQASQNNIMEKFENDMKQRKEYQSSEAQRRETYAYETQEFECVLSTEDFECLDTVRKKPSNILMELENDWNSGSSAGDAMLSADSSLKSKIADKDHAESEFSKEIRETSPQNQSFVPRSPVMIQDDAYTSREHLLCRPQESLAAVNEMNERIDKDSYQKSSQKESEYQATLRSSKVTVEDINEMQEIIDGTFDIGNVDNVSLNVCDNLPDAGSGIIENLKSQDSETLLDCSQVRKNLSTSNDELAPNLASSEEVHPKIDDHNLISSFLKDIDSDSNGSTVVFTVDEYLESSEEIEDSDSGSRRMLRKGEFDNKNHSSNLDCTPKRKSFFYSHRMQKKTRLRVCRHSKRASRKTASKKADKIQPDQETERSSTQHGNFTEIKDGKTSKEFVVTSSVNESSPESDVMIQRSIPTINRRLLNQRMVAVSSPEIPLSVSQDVGLSKQEQFVSSSDSLSSKSEDSVEECGNLFQKNLFRDDNQTTPSDPASSRDSYTGRYDRSFNPRRGCTYGASRKSPSGHINPSVRKESYSLYEDLEILNFITRHHAYDRVKGRELWQEMERCEVLPKRSWHSMKERYRKRIIPRLHTYLQFGLSRDTIRLIQSHAPSQFEEASPRTKGNESSRRPYTHVEDELIVKFIAKNRRYSEVGGKTLWVVMTSSVPGLKKRTWLSLKERFRKNIVKHLDDFSLTNDEVENFRKRSNIPVRRNGKSRRKISFRKPPERYEKHHSKPSKSLWFKRDQETKSSTDDEVETSDSEREQLRDRFANRKRVSFNKGQRKLETYCKTKRLDEKMPETRKGTKESKRYPEAFGHADDSGVQPSTSGYIPKKKDNFGVQMVIDNKTKRAEESHLAVLSKVNFKRKLFNQDEMAKLTPQAPFDRDEFGRVNSQWKTTKRQQNIVGMNVEQRRKKSKEESSCKSDQEENGSTSEEKDEDSTIAGLETTKEGEKSQTRCGDSTIAVSLEITKEGENSQTKCGKSKDDINYINLGTHEANSGGHEDQNESVLQRITRTHEANSGGHEDQNESVFQRITGNVESVVDSYEGMETLNEGPSSHSEIMLNPDDKSITQPDVTPEPDVQERPLSHLTNFKGKSLKAVILDGCVSSSNSVIDIVNVSKEKQKFEKEPDRNEKTYKNIKRNVPKRNASSQNKLSPEQVRKCSLKLTSVTTRNKLRKKIIRKKRLNL